MHQKTRTTLSWILQILVAAVLAASGFAKLAALPETIGVFETLGMEPTGRHLVGALEVLAALLLVIPFSVAWGAILAWGIMTGAVLAHLTRLGVAGPMLAGTLAATFNLCACTAILLLRRHQIEFIRCMFECQQPGKE